MRVSSVVLIVGLLVWLFWLLRGCVFIVRPTRTLTHRMLERKGVTWTVLTWWTVATIGMSLFTLFTDIPLLPKLKMVAVAGLPLLLGWRVRRFLRQRRQRRYQLSGRRR